MVKNPQLGDNKKHKNWGPPAGYLGDAVSQLEGVGDGAYDVVDAGTQPAAL